MPPKKLPVPKETPQHSAGDKRMMPASPEGRSDSKMARSEPPPFTDSTVTLDDMRMLLAPLHSEVSSLRDEISNLKQDIVSTVTRIVEPIVETRVQLSTSKLETEVSDIRTRLDKLSQKEELDRCRLQAVAFNVPASIDRSNLLQYFKQSVPDVSLLSMRLVADKDKSKGTSMCFLTFPSIENRNSFVNSFRSAGRKFSHNGIDHEITVKKCLPAAWRERNSAFRKKFDEVRLAMQSPADASIDWNHRTISVNGRVAYRQKRNSCEFEKCL